MESPCCACLPATWCVRPRRWPQGSGAGFAKGWRPPRALAQPRAGQELRERPEKARLHSLHLLLTQVVCLCRLLAELLVRELLDLPVGQPELLADEELRLKQAARAKLLEAAYNLR